jgi:hypothetical protein
VSLDGLAAGRRTVKHPSVGRVDGMSSDEGLEPLLRFPDLEVLELNRVASVSIEPLTRLPSRLLWLRIADGKDLDLEPLVRVRTTRLVLLNLDGRCRVADRFYLPEDLEVLAVAADSTKASPTVVKTLIEAIDWSRLNELRDLIVRVGGLNALPPIEVDLTFLRYLGRLERLDLGHGVWHRGPRPSPLEPPFPGLAKTLTQLHINAWEPEPLKQALHDYLPLSTPEGNPVGSVYQHYPYQPRPPDTRAQREMARVRIADGDARNRRRCGSPLGRRDGVRGATARQGEVASSRPPTPQAP